MKICPHCRKQIHDHAVHCGYCGGKVDDGGGAETILGLSPVMPGDRPEEDEEDLVATVALPALQPEDFARIHGHLPPSAQQSETEPRLPAPGREVASVVHGLPEQSAELDRAETPAIRSPVRAEPSWAPVIDEPDPAPPRAPTPSDATPDPPAPTPGDEASADDDALDRAPERARPQDAPTLVLDSPMEGLAEAIEAAKQRQGLAPPELDFGDEEPPEEVHRSGGLGRTIAFVCLIAVPLVGLLTAAAIYLAGGQIRVRFESRVVALADKGEYQITLNILVEEGDPKEPLVLSMLGKQEDFEGNRSFVFRVPKKDLKVGLNPLQAVVTQPNGDEVGRLPVSIVVDYTFDVERTVLRPDDREFTALFRVAEGANLYVDGASVRPAEDGRLSVSVGLAEVLARIDGLPHADYPYKLAFRVRRADGSEHPYAETVQLVLPSAELEVRRPPRQYLTTQARVTIVGKVGPGTEARVGGKRLRTAADGTFTHAHSLPTVGDHRVDVQAVKRGVVDVIHTLDVQRATLAEVAELNEEARLRAEDWAGGGAIRNPDYAALLQGAAGEFKGKHAVLSAKVISVQQGPESVVFVLSTCGKPASCLVWAEIEKGRIMVGNGDKGTFFGTVDGTRELPRPAGEKVKVPFLKAKHAVGG